jgi:hypothetical protein
VIEDEPAAAVLANAILRIRRNAAPPESRSARDTQDYRSAGKPPNPARWAHTAYGYSESLGCYLRVVLLSDGETVHNAFPDEGFAK